MPFVGAGASKLAGCPDWDEFANGALRLFVEHGKFSHAQPETGDLLVPVQLFAGARNRRYLQLWSVAG